MSVIVKGMDMPKSCLYCPMLNGSDECCLLSDEQNYAYDDIDQVKDNYCPLVALPKKHGRLIDGDYLYNRLKALGLKDENVFSIIKEEPTVVESEEVGMIPKLNSEAYKVCVYKADDFKAILNDIIYIPENVEKYRIPHEIASDVELRLRADMLTEEERKQAKQEEKTAYNKGLADAWEVAKKIAELPFDKQTEVFGQGIHGYDAIINKYTPIEVIAKIKAYEDKQNETKGIFECSECGYSFEHEGYKHYFNFCPCCGAKMESEG